MRQPPGQAGNLHSFFASFLTRYRLAQLPAPPDHTMDEAKLAALLAGSAVLERNPWTRIAWIDRDGEALLCAAGEEYICSIETAEQLCSYPVSIPTDDPLDSATLRLLCRLINEGHLFLSSTGEMDL
jgi:50S ribosomal protein L16 3-hydroxylase